MSVELYDAFIHHWGGRRQRCCLAVRPAPFHDGRVELSVLNTTTVGRLIYILRT